MRLELLIERAVDRAFLSRVIVQQCLAHELRPALLQAINREIDKRFNQKTGQLKPQYRPKGVLRKNGGGR
jgi:hypothetical protein